MKMIASLNQRRAMRSTFGGPEGGAPVQLVGVADAFDEVVQGAYICAQLAVEMCGGEEATADSHDLGMQPEVDCQLPDMRGQETVTAVYCPHLAFYG